MVSVGLDDLDVTIEKLYSLRVQIWLIRLISSGSKISGARVLREDFKTMGPKTTILWFIKEPEA